jgi:hypothetical protein
LTSKEIKIKRKSDNIAGLQLADMFAHPLTREVLLRHGRIDKSEVAGAFEREIITLAQAKYKCKFQTGQIRGYGRVFLQ